jgi:YfiH family protein
MWELKQKDGKVWYELKFDSNAIVIQGTKSFNPLDKMKGTACGLKQIHSSIIHKAYPGIKLVGDGIYTDERDVVIYVKTADCLPIILYHPLRVFAILHAGWRGTMLRITKKFLLQMENDLKLNIQDWIVAFGVSVGMDNYEVGEEIYELFKIERVSGIHIKENRYFLDLKEANMIEMLDMGIKTFYHFPEDTYSSEKFYSNRIGDKGRQITAGKIF